MMKMIMAILMIITIIIVIIATPMILFSSFQSVPGTSDEKEAGRAVADFSTDFLLFKSC